MKTMQIEIQTCPNCESNVLNFWNHCAECGHKQESEEPTAMFIFLKCPRCGNWLNELTAKFCWNCGKDNIKED